MKLIKPSFEILDQGIGLEGVYKQIERVGRTCYKSEDKIAEGTAKPFVDRMIKSGHGAMLEHGTIYLKLPIEVDSHSNIVSECKYKNNKYSKVNEYLWDYYVTTNLRVLIENNWTKDLQYICEPTEYHVKRVTVKFTCDRGVSHEFVRHRVFSFAQESTRYCNYTKDKFGNEITFIEPCWEMQEDEKELYIVCLENMENAYNALISSGWTPQQARAILPNSLKTELVMTGFVDDWSNFFDLRARGTTGAPHPQAKELAEPLFTEFINRNIISL